LNHLAVQSLSEAFPRNRSQNNVIFIYIISYIRVSKTIESVTVLIYQALICDARGCRRKRI